VARLQQVEEDYDAEHEELEQLESLMTRANAPKYTTGGAALGLIERVAELLINLGVELKAPV